MTDSVIVLCRLAGGAPKGKPRKMCNAGGREPTPIVFPNEFIYRMAPWLEVGARAWHKALKCH